ncbi:MAG: hypothetical protein KGN16_06035 [Burkholderiales bacterium]|nr:hypothetical protein [Burkholderiales bacterium]
MTAGNLTSDLYRVGAGFSVRFRLVDDRLDCEWTPRMPTKREFSRAADRYRAARDEFLAEWARRLGRSVICLEV